MHHFNENIKTLSEFSKLEQRKDGDSWDGLISLYEILTIMDIFKVIPMQSLLKNVIWKNILNKIFDFLMSFEGKMKNYRL